MLCMPRRARTCRARARPLTHVTPQGPMFGFYEREPVVEEDLMRLPHDLQVR